MKTTPFKFIENKSHLLASDNETANTIFDNIHLFLSEKKNPYTPEPANKKASVRSSVNETDDEENETEITD